MAKKTVEAVPGMPENELEWFDWVRRLNGRIVFHENRDCSQTCRVRTDRFFEKEAPSFIEAASACFEHYKRIKDPRGNYMRFKG